MLTFSLRLKSKLKLTGSKSTRFDQAGKIATNGLWKLKPKTN